MNWGTKLVIALALFMAFILTLSVKMIFSNDDALIEKDYYEQGLNYNKKYDARQQAVADSVVPSVDVNENGLTIVFRHPAECKLNFKRLSDAKMDTIFERSTDKDFSVRVLKGDLRRGPWLLTLNYTIDEKTYLYESEKIMP
ncbi:FixH family protein [Pedobacter sp. P351]|uniref:FixH family protein n=1 Tax=Pedobacter superstes TaxID=3133441 RepID=UPI0030ACD10E